MEQGKILEELFDKKTLSVLRILSQNPDKQYYLREIAKATRVPVATVFRITKRLVAMGVVSEIRIKLKMKLYQYGSGKESKFVEQLIEIRRGAVEEFVDACKAIDGIQQIILHGKRLKDKANILIIGQDVAKEPLGQAVTKIKEETGFTILYLVLEPNQYEQMAHMGLYAEDRQILLQRSTQQ